MVVSISFTFVALRAGLVLRRSRRLKKPSGMREARERHLAWAKPAVVLIMLGFAAGPLSAYNLRGMEVLESFHGIVGAMGALLFAVTGILGRRMESGDVGVRELHGLLGVLGVLAAAVAAVAGFSITA